VTRRLLVLLGGSLAFWLLVAIVGRWTWGDSSVAYSAAALGLCLLPAALTLVGATWAANQPADRQLTAVLGGTGIRLFVVLAGGFALTKFVPYFREHETPGFWIYVGVFYLFTLALETVLAVAGRGGVKANVLPAGEPRPAERAG
jgi:hypothetical protein